MASNNIEFRLSSRFEGEGFKKASAAIQQNQKEINSSIRGLGELSNVLGSISPQAATAASSIASFGQAFVAGGIVGGTIRLAIDGISFAVEKAIGWYKSFEERTKALAEAMRNNFLKAIGDSEARFRSLSAEVQNASQQLKDMTDVLNGSVAKDVQNKVYQLHIEKLQAVTDNMTEGGKAVVDAQFAMREATLKARAAIETSYNNLEAANAEVVNAEKIAAEAAKRVADSDAILADARQNEARDSDYFSKVQKDNADAHKALELATNNLEKARRNASDASDKVTSAERNLELTTKEHDAKIKEANKKIEEERNARNELARKEEDAAIKWREYLDGAFERERNARNELARKEEDASLAFQDYINNLKESAGLVNEQSVDDFLQDLADILEGKATSSSSSAVVNESPDVNLKNPIPLPVQVPQAQPVVRGFGQHLADLRNVGREQRNLISDLKGDYEREITQYMLALNTDRSQRTQQQNDMISYYNDTFIPNLVSQYGPSVVEKLFTDANGKVMLKHDWERFFSPSGGFHNMLAKFFNKLGLK